MAILILLLFLSFMISLAITLDPVNGAAINFFKIEIKNNAKKRVNDTDFLCSLKYIFLGAVLSGDHDHKLYVYTEY